MLPGGVLTMRSVFSSAIANYSISVSNLLTDTEG